MKTKICLNLVFLLFINSLLILSVPITNFNSIIVAQIGSTVLSDSMQVKLLKVEKKSIIKGNDIKINSEEGSILLIVTLELKNLKETKVELDLPKDKTFVKSLNQQWQTYQIGVLLKGEYYFVYGTKGSMERKVPDSFVLTGDFSNNLWEVILMGGSSMNAVLVFSIPRDSSGFKLFLPGFDSIHLNQ